MLSLNTFSSSLFRGFLFKPFVAIAAAIAVSMISWNMDRASLNLQLSTYTCSYGFFANALPVILLFTSLLVLSNRLMLSTTITLVVMALLYTANSLKMQNLLHPIVFTDIFFLREINGSVLRLLSNYLHLSWFLYGGIFLAILILLLKFEPNYFTMSSITRWILLLVLIPAIALIVIRPPGMKYVYDADKLRVVPWSPGETQLHCGLLGSIIYDSIEAANALRQPTDYPAIERFLAITSPSAPTWHGSLKNHPDIIIIQSESFFDPAILKDIDNTDALLPNLHRAQTLGYGGKMKVPTFGGGTLRTEFEVLTSVPMRAIPRIQFPYLQIHSKVLPSIVQVMRDNGYKSYAVHPNDPSFWNRSEAFQSMGFDAFYSLADFPVDAAKDGWYLADSALTTKIESILDKAIQPTFIMNISIEGHGPYDTVPVANKEVRDHIEVPPVWPSQADDEYRNYAYHIHNADHEMGRLWDYLVARKKPFILVFYGDHLPGLPATYKAAGGFDDGIPGDQQPVPWLLISNEEARAPIRDIYSWMLGGAIFCAANITPPDYYALLNKAGSLLSVPGSPVHEDDVFNGVDSLAWLHLRNRTLPEGAKSTVKQSKCFYPAKGVIRQ
jgi:phosphoglycerol transferase MdoB-like AlkP superfamily enzyme